MFVFLLFLSFVIDFVFLEKRNKRRWNGGKKRKSGEVAIKETAIKGDPVYRDNGGESRRRLQEHERAP